MIVTPSTADHRQTETSTQDTKHDYNCHTQRVIKVTSINRQPLFRDTHPLILLSEILLENNSWGKFRDRMRTKVFFAEDTMKHRAYAREINYLYPC